MAINTARTRDINQAWPPDEDPDIARALVEAWSAAYQDEGTDAKTMRPGLYLRASDAGACARALGYRIRRRKHDQELLPHLAEGLCQGGAIGGPDPADQVDCPTCTAHAESAPDPLSEPPTVADQYRMNIGTLIHDEMGRHLQAAFPGAEVEVLCIREDIPGISMHIDAVVTMEDGTKIVVEVKTINGMGFKRSVGAAKQSDPAQGPRWNAIVQGALAAHEQKADRLVVIVFALELISKSVAQRYKVDTLGTMVAQWTVEPDEFTPIAERELARMKACLTLVEQGELPPRSIPDRELPTGNRITDPANGSWVLEDAAGNPINLGNTWHCDYCWDRGNCIKDGPT